MTDFEELREALDVVEAHPEFVPGQWAIEPEMFEPDCLCDEDIAYIAAANPATIRALLAELDAARRDAERWRWMRDEAWGGNNKRGPYLVEFKAGYTPSLFTMLAEEAADAAIDTAMKEQQP